MITVELHRITMTVTANALRQLAKEKNYPRGRIDALEETAAALFKLVNLEADAIIMEDS